MAVMMYYTRCVYVYCSIASEWWDSHVYVCEKANWCLMMMRQHVECVVRWRVSVCVCMLLAAIHSHMLCNCQLSSSSTALPNIFTSHIAAVSVAIVVTTRRRPFAEGSWIISNNKLFYSFVSNQCHGVATGEYWIGMLLLWLLFLCTPNYTLAYLSFWLMGFQCRHWHLMVFAKIA